MEPETSTTKYILVDVSKLKFELLPEGYALGSDSLSWLIPLWFKLQFCIAIIGKYSSFFDYVSHALIVIRMISWSGIIISLENIESGRDTLFLMSKHIFTRSFATESFFVKKHLQKKLETELKSQYKKGHIITTDLDAETLDGKVPFINSPTHGAGSLDL
jgi:hypothetical protein